MASRRTRAHARTIPRKIYFYKAIFSAQGNAGRTRNVADPRPVFAHVHTLGFGGANPGTATSNYHAISGGNYVAMFSVQDVPFGVRGIVGTIRRNALPDIERLGQLQALNIPPDAGLFEATHFILFLPHRILGMEFNLYGPRTGQLGDYLLNKCAHLVNDVNFLPILRHDVQQRLNEIGEIAELQIAVHRNETSTMRQLDESLPSAFNAVKRISSDDEFEIIEVTLRKRPYSRRGFHLPFQKQKILRFLSNARTRDTLAEFRVRARNTRTQGIETFDLLEDKMVSVARVVPSGDRRRSIDSESMFSAIQEAFNVQREELVSLLGH